MAGNLVFRQGDIVTYKERPEIKWWVVIGQQVETSKYSICTVHEEDGKYQKTVLSVDGCLLTPAPHKIENQNMSIPDRVEQLDLVVYKIGGIDMFLVALHSCDLVNVSVTEENTLKVLRFYDEDKNMKLKQHYSC